MKRIGIVLCPTAILPFSPCIWGCMQRIMQTRQGKRRCARKKSTRGTRDDANVQQKKSKTCPIIHKLTSGIIINNCWSRPKRSVIYNLCEIIPDLASFFIVSTWFPCPYLTCQWGRRGKRNTFLPGEEFHRILSLIICVAPTSNRTINPNSFG